MLNSEKGKVLLLHSSFVNTTLADPALRIAPLGLFYINSFLKSRGYSTKIVIIKNNEDYIQKLGTIIQDFSPDYIGYSFRNLYVHSMPQGDPAKLINFFYMSLEKPVIDFLRTITKAVIVGGGSAFSIAPRLYMRYLGLDFGIVGEGEVAFEKLLAHVAGKENTMQLPGLAYKHNNEIVVNKPHSLDDLSVIPAIDTGELAEYSSFYYENGGYGNIQTKRGCQFHCLYCVYPHLEGSVYRLRNVKTICDELAVIKKQHNINHFFIVDSVFSFPTEHSVSFCKELLRRKMNIEWTAYINPRGISKEVLQVYKQSGCKNLVLTPDTFSPRMLNIYRKDFTIKEVDNCIKLLYEVGIPFEVSLIIGGPGEDKTSVQETIRFCDRYLKDTPVIVTNGFWLHPDAPAMKTAQREGHFAGLEDFRFDKIVLENDFIYHGKLHYFFPNISPVSTRKEFLLEMFAGIRRHKRIVIGMDFSYEKQTDRCQYHEMLKVEPYARPWHKGMVGRSELTK